MSKTPQKEEAFDTTFKIFVIGDNNSGKSSFIIRYISGFFLEAYTEYWGIGFYSKIVNIEGERVKIQMWDFKGSAQLRLPQYSKEGNGIIIICDITNRSSLTRLPNWILLVREHIGDIPIILIGSKRDLEENRAFSPEEGILAAKKYNLFSYIEVSAKYSKKIPMGFEGFLEVVSDYKKRIDALNTIGKSTTVLKQEEETRKKIAKASLQKSYDRFKSYEKHFPEILNPPGKGITVSKDRLKSMKIIRNDGQEIKSVDSLIDEVAEKGRIELESLLLKILEEVLPPNKYKHNYDKFNERFFKKVKEHFRYGKQELNQLVEKVEKCQLSGIPFGQYFIKNFEDLNYMDVSDVSDDSDQDLPYIVSNNISDGTINIPILKGVDSLEPIRIQLRDKIYEELSLRHDFICGDTCQSVFCFCCGNRNIKIDGSKDYIKCPECHHLLSEDVSYEFQIRGDAGLIISCPYCSRNLILKDKKCTNCDLSL